MFKLLHSGHSKFVDPAAAAAVSPLGNSGKSVCRLIK
jgi:hypothetical protein